MPPAAVPCRLCGTTESPKADAHIVPKSFFLEAKEAQGEPFLLAIARDGSKWPSRLWIGEYDPNILCVKCEAKHCDIDGYGFEALVRTRYQRTDTFSKKQLLLKYASPDAVDARRLRAFFYFTLLKAGWSQRDSYVHVDLPADLEQHFVRTVEDRVEPEGYPIRVFLVQHGLVEPDFVKFPTIYSGGVTVIPKAGHVIYQVCVHDYSALIFVGPGMPSFSETAHLALLDGKRVSVLRSRKLDESMENWVAELVADRLRSGGDRWEKRR